MEAKMTMVEAVERRMSVRSFDMKGLSQEELKQITDYAASLPTLLPGQKIRADIIGPDDVKAIMKWRAPHYLAIYAEDSDAGLMNAGFVYEQVALYLTTLGIGTCWATSVSPKEKKESDGLHWAAVIAFGRPAEGNGWREAGTAKRNAPDTVYDRKDAAVEAARLAPSSMNNQPWKFRHDSDAIQVFCKKQGLLKKWMVSQNRIDIGIALGNMKAVSDEFAFTLPAAPAEPDGYTLMGSVTIGL